MARCLMPWMIGPPPEIISPVCKSILIRKHAIWIDTQRFLSDLRRQLPAKYRLSITGLLDWSANGDPEKLAALGNMVDEIVVQTYQGRKTIPGYENYLARLVG